MRHLLAIDAGGTKCEALLLSEEGQVLGRGRCDIGHPESGRGLGGCGRSADTVAQAVRQALASAPTASELHVAGWGMAADALKGLAGPGVEVIRHGFGESEGALALAGSRAGVVALAGTGALAYARATDGRELLLDALGPLLGDHGSAYHLGLMAVRAVAQAGWHPRHRTSLEEPVLRTCAALVGDPPHFSLVHFMLEPRDRAELACLARLVDEHANAGDSVAQGLLRTAADALAETVWDVVDRLGIAQAELPLVGTGSVATRSRIYWARLCERAHGFAPRLQPILPSLPAVAGVALALASRMPGVDVDRFRRGLEEAAAAGGL
ncbi:MAG TPA: BadF/BadG/BcrA/BcrD ATPase family protein [Armatimonadota bacterium]|jgi:N-acetylglucosamine kinase-like BadF-type ATPase